MRYFKSLLTILCVLSSWAFSSCDKEKEEKFSDALTVGSTNQVVQFYRKFVDALENDLRVESIENTAASSGMKMNDGSVIGLAKNLDRHSCAPEIAMINDGGEYCWTIRKTQDYELLLGDGGEKQPVKSVTPRIKGRDGQWAVSLDEGQTWRNVAGVRGTVTSAYVPDKTLFRDDNDFVEVNISYDHPTFRIAKKDGALISINRGDRIWVKSGVQVELSYTVAGNVSGVSVAKVNGGHTAAVDASANTVTINTAARQTGVAALTLKLALRGGATQQKTVNIVPATGEIVWNTFNLAASGVMYTEELMFSVNRYKKQWSIDSDANLTALFKKGLSNSDGKANMATIKEGYPLWYQMHPAFGCAFYEQIPGWYLPSHDELYGLSQAVQKNFAAFNQALSAAGGAAFTYSGEYYWSSSKSSVMDLVASALQISGSGFGSGAHHPSCENYVRLINGVPVL